MAVTVLAAAAAQRRKVEQEQAIAASFEGWKPVAAYLGLTLDATGPRPVVSGSLRGIPCRLTIELDKYGWAHTRASADVPRKIDATIAVYPSPTGVLGFLKSLVTQDIQVGDEVFDDSFLVQGKPEEAALGLLQPAMRDLLQRMEAKFTAFNLTVGRADVQMPGVETNVDRLEVALLLVAEAALWDPKSQAFR